MGSVSITWVIVLGVAFLVLFGLINQVITRRHKEKLEQESKHTLEDAKRLRQLSQEIFGTPSYEKGLEILAALAATRRAWEEEVETEIVAIGRALDEKGGLYLMRSVLDDTLKLGTAATGAHRRIERIWDGIGGWRG